MSCLSLSVSHDFLLGQSHAEMELRFIFLGRTIAVVELKVYKGHWHVCFCHVEIALNGYELNMSIHTCRRGVAAPYL